LSLAIDNVNLGHCFGVSGVGDLAAGVSDDLADDEIDKVDIDE